MNPIIRKKLKILVFLALADKHFADQEREFIEKICERNELDPRIIDELINDPEPIGSLGALSYQKSVEYLTDSVMLMVVDGKVLPSEILFCQDIAIRLGFSKRAADELIGMVSSGKTISRERLNKQVLRLPHDMKMS